MLILGIESTCDETGCAIVKDGKEILSNVVASQIDLHKAYGGVVPELACRRHIDVLIPVVDQALKEAHVTLEQVDAIAVAHGPGLIGALLIGMQAAKGLALALEKPLILVNHIEAHLYAAMMEHLDTLSFPCLGVVISGGHTALLKIERLGKYTLLGQTQDDAAGEAFDKVAAMLGLPYPGGPAIEALAKSGDPRRYNFRPGIVKERPLDFSFSGLKTKVLYTIKGQSCNKNMPLVIREEDKKDVAAAFQQAALSDIVSKVMLALEAYPCAGVIFGGGVSNNRYLRHLFASAKLKVPLYWPPPALSLDNGAMIAALAYPKWLENPVSAAMDAHPIQGLQGPQGRFAPYSYQPRMGTEPIVNFRNDISNISRKRG